MSKKYFEVPTQVGFYDPGSAEYCCGIAYKGEIICACCGGIFEVEEVDDIVELSWVSLSNAISDNELEG